MRRLATRPGFSFDGIDVILNSTRAQSFDPSLFSAMGIDPKSRKILLIKSTNHFYDSFSQDRVRDRLLLGGQALSEHAGDDGLPQGAAGYLADGGESVGVADLRRAGSRLIIALRTISLLDRRVAVQDEGGDSTLQDGWLTPQPNCRT